MINFKHPGLLKPGGTFFDLGSGVGKGIIGATLLHDFDKCIGIEILDSLNKMALELKQIYEEFVKNYKEGIENTSILLKKNQENSSDSSSENIDSEDNNRSHKEVLNEENVLIPGESTALKYEIKFPPIEFIHGDILKVNFLV